MVYLLKEKFNKKFMLIVKKMLIHKYRAIAQFGSASALGAECRRFKSCYPDLFTY